MLPHPSPLNLMPRPPTNPTQSSLLFLIRVFGKWWNLLFWSFCKLLPSSKGCSFQRRSLLLERRTVVCRVFGSDHQSGTCNEERLIKELNWLRHFPMIFWRWWWWCKWRCCSLLKQIEILREKEFYHQSQLPRAQTQTPKASAAHRWERKHPTKLIRIYEKVNCLFRTIASKY